MSPLNGIFHLDPSYAYRPRQLEAAISELNCISEELRHRIFTTGFQKLPDNGAQATLERLLMTHTEPLHEAFHIECKRRYGKMIDVGKRHNPAAIDLLHKLASPR